MTGVARRGPPSARVGLSRGDSLVTRRQRAQLALHEVLSLLETRAREHLQRDARVRFPSTSAGPSSGARAAIDSPSGRSTRATISVSSSPT